MVRVYDEVELDDMSYDEAKDVFHFPCPCGDRFEISMAQLRDAEDIARCPSCSLIIRVIFDPVSGFRHTLPTRTSDFQISSDGP